MASGFEAQARWCRRLARFPLTRGYAKRAFTRLVTATSPAPVVDGEIAGLPVRLDLSKGWDRKIYLHGIGDARAIETIGKLMDALDCRTAWDVGANRGNHSAAMVGHCRRLYAFEPDPTQFPRLSALLAGAPSATAVPLGLSEGDGELPFFFHCPGASASFERDDRAPDAVARVVAGDRYARDHGVDDLDFVKIDVEGHETKVLRGLREVLAVQRPVLVLEVLARHAAGRADGELRALLPDYLLFGNYQGLKSRIFMSGCHFGRFREGRSYTHALAVPREKLGRLAGLVDAAAA
jgi:FkbM family methyltransferase